MNCINCGLPLNKSQYAMDRRYKSCPKCSVLNGSEHVFFEYPLEFGQSSKRITFNNPDGPQSYCYEHREDITRPITSGGIECSKLK